ncbi:UDP-N-acetylmuramoyl-L-alanine--D-glutamate ligase [Komagataeibacter rhaeticus]|uniref:UDP-N-acetylmuramoyl-L-alanine--D-glutamate ligase n=1 Tax=Komagataeibacter rhaeticus TaxID=215221 RepID=UPI0004D88289|nr:UDP-N-acetylmuramoyl-L-alanine--D-glutamate ligase [Komagataeibacter rhaeticus]KDU96801.1 UDP-N-acetylmuramoyl-L-alanyl-D-glutamate synthetase [Komagataeibacter rhaeticus AF1]MBL7240194.1 UDP-N-acetylmuramoyl-L-alanine--D-glutamate ligase [Komagataeibacter rhaeticus]PYD52799.1 UDP-N-acetylmuramoyl-L-alanine--D-glutamate ligase [Komagataeibacter rhaeticus]GBQ10661.1 UDP-N-acetylmuramoyl-L-alanyl-D-glutamate synthetase [Komagataeibacter rhaeticus DSM 16663]
MSTSFPPTLFAGHHYGVAGLGRNGNAAVGALLAMGASVQAWDDNAASRDALPTHERLTLAPFTGMVGLAGLVLSPGIPHILPSPHPLARMAVEAGVPIVSDAELLFRAVRAAGSRARFAGITGTNGKSTTTVLLTHMLACCGIPVAAGGNLGPAALALPLLPDDGVYVLEMSSYMLERLEQLHFSAACLLNLTPDHLDRHGDMAGYTAAKLHVFDHQHAGDLAVLGATLPDYARIHRGLAATRVRIACVSGADVEQCDYYCTDHALCDHSGVIAGLDGATDLPGTHNRENAAAATAMALHLGMPRAAVEGALATFSALDHRQKLVGRIGTVRFINDSKATNADATARALACHDRLVWIAGGTAKAGGIEELAPLFGHVALALLIGRDAPVLAATLTRHGVPHRIVHTLERAVPEAREAARALGVDVVMLSPACASFDQFSGFEARGAHFAALVRDLDGTAGGPTGA